MTQDKAPSPRRSSHYKKYFHHTPGITTSIHHHHLRFLYGPESFVHNPRNGLETFTETHFGKNNRKDHPDTRNLIGYRRQHAPNHVGSFRPTHPVFNLLVETWWRLHLECVSPSGGWNQTLQQLNRIADGGARGRPVGHPGHNLLPGITLHIQLPCSKSDIFLSTAMLMLLFFSSQFIKTMDKKNFWEYHVFWPFYRIIQNDAIIAAN